jgi:deoxyribodipyrimidine photolyase
MGGASRWWLHHSLAALDADLRARGFAPDPARGQKADVLAALARKPGAKTRPRDPPLRAVVAQCRAEVAKAR